MQNFMADITLQDKIDCIEHSMKEIEQRVCRLETNLKKLAKASTDLALVVKEINEFLPQAPYGRK